MKTGGSFSCSRMGASCLYPETDQCSPSFPTHFLKIQLHTTLLSMPVSSKWSIFLRVHHQNPIYTSPLPHLCYMPLPSNYFRCDHSNNILRREQIIKLHNMYSSPVTCFLVPLRSKDSSRYPIHKHPQPTLIPECELPRFTLIQNSRKLIFLNNLILIFLINKLGHKRFCAQR